MLFKVLIVAKTINKTNLLLNVTKLFNELLLIYLVYLTLNIFFLIISFLAKLINLRERFFFDFNNKIIDVKDAIEIHCIIIFE